MDNMGKWIDEQSVILEQEMIEAKSKEMQQEIDREILWGMLQGLGWSRVMLPTLGNGEQAVDIIIWLEQNCKYSYERSGRDFLFESKQDANWFKLRWGTV
jgi:hypothetical protein